MSWPDKTTSQKAGGEPFVFCLLFVSPVSTGKRNRSWKIMLKEYLLSQDSGTGRWISSMP